MARKLRVAAYARVSSLKRTQDESPQHQFDDIASYYVRRDDCEIVMQEMDRISGGKGEEKRPGLAKIMEAARARKIDVIAVTKLSRVFRSVRKWTMATMELEAYGVVIVFTHYPMLDQTTAQGRLMINIHAALDEFYRDSYADAAVEGKAKAEAAGKHCARPYEIIPVAALKLADAWIKAGESLTWSNMSERLARSGYRQPERVIKTTGELRKARPWPRGSLWRVYTAWVEAGRPESSVQKTPQIAAPRTGEISGSDDPDND